MILWYNKPSVKSNETARSLIQAICLASVVEASHHAPKAYKQHLDAINVVLRANHMKTIKLTRNAAAVALHHNSTKAHARINMDFYELTGDNSATCDRLPQW
jgi:hypothetical protein